MKRLNYIFIFLALCYSLSADNYIDSLKQRLKTNLQDSERVAAYVGIANNYGYSNIPDSALRFFDLATKLAKKVSDIKFATMVLYYQGYFYQNDGNYAAAINYFTKALTNYIKINRTIRIGDTYNSLGVTYYYKGNFDSAIVCYNKAVPYFEKAKDNLGAARCYNNIGIMFDVKGDRVKSVESYIKAIKIYEKNKREDLNIGPYQNIALVYLTHKQFPEALKNLEIAKSICVKYKDDENLCRVFNSMGSTLDNMGRGTEATHFFIDALGLADKLNNESLKAISLTNLGENYLVLKKYEEGEKTLLQCVELKKKLDNPVSLGISQIALAQAYFKNKKFDLAIQLYKAGLKKVETADYKEYQKTALEGLAASYASTSDYREAYSNLNQYVKINDSLLNESNEKMVSELQTKYETDKKEAEIKLLSKDKALQDEAFKRKNTEFKMVLGIAGVGLVLLIYVVISLKNKRKANRILESKNIEISRQKDIVDEKQKEIVDSINYAKRIQQSLMPTEKYIERNINKLKSDPGK